MVTTHNQPDAVMSSLSCLRCALGQERATDAMKVYKYVRCLCVLPSTKVQLGLIWRTKTRFNQVSFWRIKLRQIQAMEYIASFCIPSLNRASIPRSQQNNVLATTDIRATTESSQQCYADEYQALRLLWVMIVLFFSVRPPLKDTQHVDVNGTRLTATHCEMARVMQIDSVHCQSPAPKLCIEKK